MNEWLKIMLEEIRRKRAEAEEQRREHERREGETLGDDSAADRPSGRERGEP